MKSKSEFAHSLLLATAASFMAPMMLAAIVCLGLQLWTYLPGIGGLGVIGHRGIAGFLRVFGDGSPVQGILTISLVCAVVGALFDAYAYYSFSNQRHQ